VKKLSPLFFALFATLFVAAPAFATSHNQAPVENWLERGLLVALPIALIVFFALRGQKRWAIASVITFIAPLAWAFYRVWSMGGPYVPEHFGKHHAEAVPLMLVFVVLAVLVNARARLPQSTTS
jgi:hypothetical protein